MTFFGSIFLVTALGANPIQQGPEKPRVVEVIPQTIYTPKNFDSNDVAQFIIEGEFPSACYRIGKVRAEADEEKIIFKVLAYQYGGPCVQVMTPYLTPVDVDILDEGNYPIWNASKKDKPMGYLNIHKTSSTKRDDFEYANVDSAVVFYDSANQRNVLTLFGTHSQSCFTFDREKFFLKRTAKDLIEVLPILKRQEGVECKNGEFKFRESFVISESIPAGRYLFHIRKSDGQSFNKVDFVKTTNDSEPEKN